MKKVLIFPSKHFLAGGSSLLEPKNPPMYIDATYGTYDKWNNYALEWYQVVLGCLRVHKNVFTKIAITEVNFSHRPKIAILWVGPNCTHFRQLLWIQLAWCDFGASTTTRKSFGPPEVFLKTVLWDDFFSGSILPNYWKLLRVKNCSKAHDALFQCL